MNAKYFLIAILALLFSTAMLFLTPLINGKPASTFQPSAVSNSAPAQKQKSPEKFNVHVLDLGYIPLRAGQVDTSLTGDWRDQNVGNLEANLDNLREKLVDALEKGSVYHGYADASAGPALEYEILDRKIFYEPVPKSPEYSGMDGAPSADHLKILNDLDICDYVENREVKEVWIWMYHTKEIAPIESNMAGPYGNISNSYGLDDLPKCRKTYVVYDYNYGRSVAMALEDHTHQIEAVLNAVDQNLFWNMFVGQNSTGGRCGWTHYPPNGVRDYDWNNENAVMSDCEDWKPEGGARKKVDCHTWSESFSACANDEGLSFKIWWMQNIPGRDNNLFYNGRKLKNWWSFVGDFDNAMKDRSLVE